MLKKYFLLRSADGFILPATLFVLSAILVAATWYASWTSSMLRKASGQIDHSRFEQDAQSTFSVLMHNVATGHPSRRGIYPGKQMSADTANVFGAPQEDLPEGSFELAFDDTCYRGIGDVLFSIQDESGLIGVSFFTKNQMRSLLTLNGVAVERQGALIDKLQDYLDPDDLLRLNGAEKNEYRRAGKEGPANARLLNATELYNVLEWDTIPGLWETSDFRRLITVATIGVPNLNTAPKAALMTVPTINETLATAIVENRKQRGYSSLTAVEAAVGRRLGLDPFGLGFYPGKQLRISLWHPALHIMREIHVQLTPEAENQQPWFIDYEIIVPRPPHTQLKNCETVTEIFSY